MKHTTSRGRVLYFGAEHDRILDIGTAPGSVSFVALHPDTDPQVIHAMHQREVADAVKVHGTDAAAISEMVMLSIPMVNLHLAELGLTPQPETTENRRKRLRAVDRICDVLAAASKPMTLREIADAAGIPRKTVEGETVRGKHNDLFVRVMVATNKGRCTPLYAYTLRETMRETA